MRLQDFMNLQVGNRPNTLRNTMLTREERVKREGSPYYTWTPGAIAAAAQVSIFVPDQFPASRKYTPLDWCEVVNNEAANNLRIVINGNETLPVPAGTIRTIRAAFRQVTIINDGGGITTAGLIYATFKKEALTIDRWSRGERA